MNDNELNLLADYFGDWQVVKRSDDAYLRAVVASKHFQTWAEGNEDA